MRPAAATERGDAWTPPTWADELDRDAAWAASDVQLAAAARAARAALREPAARDPLAPACDAADLLATPPPPIDWALPAILPVGCMGILAGADGTGKSWLALALAVAVATGTPWAGGLCPSPQAGPVLYISGEDDRDEVARRVGALREAHGVTPAPGQIRVQPLTEPWPLLAAGRQDATPSATPALAELAGMIADVTPRLVILDPMIMFHALSENDQQHMDYWGRQIIRVARNSHCGVMIVHHAGQAATRDGAADHMIGRGSTAIHAPARAVVTLRRPTQAEAADLEAAEEAPSRWRKVTGPKISRGPEVAGAWIRFDTAGVPWIEPAPIPDVPGPRKRSAASGSTRPRASVAVVPPRRGRQVTDWAEGGDQ